MGQEDGQDFRAGRWAASDALIQITRRDRPVAVFDHREPAHRLSSGRREGEGSCARFSCEGAQRLELMLPLA